MYVAFLGILGLVLRPKSFLVRVALSARAFTSFVLTSTRSTVSFPIVIVSIAMDSLPVSVVFARFSIAMNIS